MDAIDQFAHHVAETRSEDIPGVAVSAAETLILDTIGVGIGGSAGPKARDLADVQDQFGKGTDAHVWSLGKRLPASAAALCNAYQIHNSEYDCVHEEAVAHVLSAVVPAALAHAERVGGIDGQSFIDAVILGVDVAANLGVAATSGLRFFRPATVGAFGATAALGRLMGMDANQLRHAFSLSYGQLCGTMQAHEEGSMLLAMQMGFNARNAVIATDLAAAGFTGPAEVLEGRFGYFNLIETSGTPAEAAATLGNIWRITEVAHKPFPSGRATHGVIDGCLELRERHNIQTADVASIEAVVPPLVHQLVGRPPRLTMDVNYARLCAAYVAARALLSGTITPADFEPDAYADPATQALAQLATIMVDPQAGPNALTPVSLTIRMTDGAVHSTRLDAVYGSPAKPMPREAQLMKFRTNTVAALLPLGATRVNRLIGYLERLRELDDVAKLVPDMIGGAR